MADIRDAGPGEDAPVLLILVASSSSMLDDIITAMLDLGISGATVIESKGLGAILRDEMPIFAGLASMIPENTGSRVVLSATSQTMADGLFQFIEEELAPSERPIALTAPVSRFLGPSR